MKPPYLLTPMDWAGIVRRQASQMLGTPEGAEKLAEAARYEALGNEIKRLNDALAEVHAALQDPVRVHAALLRGEIAKPAIRDMLHVYGERALRRWDSMEAQEEL